MRIVYRQTQKIPFEKWLQELELERATDEEESRLGHPLPRRYRYFSGAENSQIRVHIRAYDDFAAFGRLFEEWADDEVCQKLEVERHNYYEWEREELLYIDDPADLAALRHELIAQGKPIAPVYSD